MDDLHIFFVVNVVAECRRGIFDVILSLTLCFRVAKSSVLQDCCHFPFLFCSIKLSTIDTYLWSFAVVRDLCSTVKVKVWTLAIAPLTGVRLVTSSTLQSCKWQLIGMSQWCRSALCGHPLPALTDSWTHGAASRLTIAPISHTRPSPHSRSYYSFPVPLRNGNFRWW